MDFFGSSALMEEDSGDMFFGVPGAVAATTDVDIVASSMSSAASIAPSDGCSMSVDTTDAQPAVPSLLSSASAERERKTDAERAKMLGEFRRELSPPSTTNVAQLSMLGARVATKLLFQGTALVAYANRDSPHEISRRLERRVFASATFPASPTPDSSHATVLLLECAGMFELAAKSDNAALASRTAVLAAALLVLYARRAMQYLADYFQLKTLAPQLLPEVEAFALRLHATLATAVTAPNVADEDATKTVASVLGSLVVAPLKSASFDSTMLSRAQLLSGSLPATTVTREITPLALKKDPRFRSDMAIFSRDPAQPPLSTVEKYFMAIGQLNVAAARALASAEFQQAMFKRQFDVAGKPPLEVAIREHLALQASSSSSSPSDSSDRALLRCFLFMWLPAMYGFGYEPASNEFRVERFLPQLMCFKGSGQFSGLLPLLSLPLRAIIGTEVGDSLGSFSLFRAVCTFAATVRKIQTDGSGPDTSSVDLGSMPSKLILDWAAATINSAAPDRFSRSVSLAVADGPALHNNLMAGLAFYSIFTRLEHTFPSVVVFQKRAPLLQALSRPLRLGSAEAERLFETANALLGDRHQSGTPFSPLHGAFGPGAADFLRTHTLASATATAPLVIFLGYANARAPLVLASIDPTVTCICVTVSGEFHDRHTQAAQSAAERVRDMMAMQVRDLDRRVKFITSGTVESFHADFSSLYLQALAAWARRNAGARAPGRVVLVANGYHASMEFNVPSELYSTWIEHMLRGAAQSAPFSGNNLSRLMMVSTAPPRLDAVRDAAILKRLMAVPIAVGRDLGQGILPLDALSDHLWLVATSDVISAAPAQIPLATSRERALEFAKTVLFQTNDDTARAWISQADPLAREATQASALVAAAGAQVVLLAELVQRQLSDWQLALGSVFNEDARQSINLLMEARANELVSQLADTVIVTSNHASAESKRAAHLIVNYIFQQWAHSLISADSNSVMEALKLVLERLASAEPSELEVAVRAFSPSTPEAARSISLPLTSSSALFATVAPARSYSVLASSATTSAATPTQQPAAAAMAIRSMAPQRATPKGRAQTAQLTVSAITGSSAIKPDEIAALENPVIDVKVIADAVTMMRGLKVRDNDCLEELSQWAASLGRLFSLSDASSTDAINSMTSAPDDEEYRSPGDTVFQGPTPPISSEANSALMTEARTFENLTRGVHSCLLKLTEPAENDAILRERGFDVLAPGMVYLQMIANVVHAVTQRIVKVLDKRSFSSGVLMSDAQLFEYLGGRLGIQTATLSRLQQLVFFHSHWIAPFTAGVDMYTGGSAVDVKPSQSLFVAKQKGILSKEHADLMRQAGSESLSSIAERASDVKKALQEDKTIMDEESARMMDELARRTGDDPDKMFALSIAMSAAEHAVAAPLLPFAAPPLSFMSDHVRIPNSPESDLEDAQVAQLVSKFREIAELGQRQTNFEELGPEGRNTYAALISGSLSAAVRGYFFGGMNGAISEMTEYGNRLAEDPEEAFIGADDWRIASDNGLQSALENLSTRYFLYNPVLIEDTTPLESIGVHPNVIAYIRGMYAKNADWRTVELLDASGQSMGAHFVPSANPGNVLALDSSGGRDGDEDGDEDDGADSSKALKLLKANRDYSLTTRTRDLRTNAIVCGGIRDDPSIVFTITQDIISPTTKAKLTTVASKLNIGTAAIQVESILESNSAKEFRWNMYTGFVPPAFAAALVEIARQRGLTAPPPLRGARTAAYSELALSVFNARTKNFEDWIEPWKEIQDKMNKEALAALSADADSSQFVPTKTAYKWAVMTWMYGNAGREHVLRAIDTIAEQRKEAIQTPGEDKLANNYSLSAQLAIYTIIDTMNSVERDAFFMAAPYVAYAMDLAQPTRSSENPDAEPDENDDGEGDGDADMADAPKAEGGGGARGEVQDALWINIATDLANSPPLTFSSPSRSAVVRVFVAWCLFMRYDDSAWARLGSSTDHKTLLDWANSLKSQLAKRDTESNAQYEDRINSRVLAVAGALTGNAERPGPVKEKFDRWARLAMIARNTVTAKDLGIEWALEPEFAYLAGNAKAIEAEVIRRNKPEAQASIWLDSARNTRWYAVQLWRKALRNAASVMHPDVIGRFYPAYVTVRHAAWNVATWTAISVGTPAQIGDAQTFFLQELDEALRRVLIPLYRTEREEQMKRAARRRIAPAKEAQELGAVSQSDLLRAALADFMHEGYQNFNALVDSISKNNALAVRTILETLPSMSYATRAMSNSLVEALTGKVDNTLSLRGAATSKPGIPYHPATEITIVRLRATIDEGGLEQKQKNIKEVLTDGQIFITDELVRMAGPAAAEVPEFAELERRAIEAMEEASTTVQGSSDPRGDAKIVGELFQAVVHWIFHTKSPDEADVRKLYTNIHAQKAAGFQHLMDLLVTFMYTKANMGSYTIAQRSRQDEPRSSSRAAGPHSSSSLASQAPVVPKQSAVNRQ